MDDSNVVNIELQNADSNNVNNIEQQNPDVNNSEQQNADDVNNIEQQNAVTIDHDGHSINENENGDDISIIDSDLDEGKFIGVFHCSRHK